MEIIYHNFWSSGGALMAAALHLEMVSSEQLPTEKELKKLLQLLPFPPEKGYIYPLGKDEMDNRINVLFRGKKPEVLANTILGLAEIFGRKASDLFLIDTDLGQKRGLRNRFFYGLGLSRRGELPLFKEAEAIFFDLVSLVQINKKYLSLNKGE